MNKPKNDALRALPSIDVMLTRAAADGWIEQYGRPLTLTILRETLEDARSRLRAGEPYAVDVEALSRVAADSLESRSSSSLRPVINATGVIIHTNLGRSPLSAAAIAAVNAAAAEYSTLEYDLAAGERGSRTVHAEPLICELTGAEAALVVTNCAGALFLSLSALARKREVIVSRGQAVEIGGGFRIPEIMLQSGARLVEVGTTNRTRISDYDRAVRDRTALLLRVHPSNFQQIGFVESASIAEMAELAHRHHLYALDDLGSGSLLDTAAYGLAHEPMPQESLAAGADLVMFSGDKLLGGPQAGILIGKRVLIDQLKRHPLARALRPDKLTLAGLVATLRHYQHGTAVEQIPIWQMIARPLSDLRAQAESWAAEVGGLVISGESTLGGGSLPGSVLPTALLALESAHPADLQRRLRLSDPPLIVRVSDGRVLLDPRTVLPHQVQRTVALLRRHINEHAASS